MSLRVRIAPAALAVVLLPGSVTGQVAGGTASGPAAPGGGEAWSTSPAVGLGPLAHASGSPTAVFRLVYFPMSPTTLPRGQWEVHTSLDWANFFCNGKEQYLLDFEALRFRLGTAYGITDRTEVAVGGSVSYQGGGILDGFIEGFERAIGHSNKERRAAPRDQYLVRWRDREGTVHELTPGESGWHVDSVGLLVAHRLMVGSERRLLLDREAQQLDGSHGGGDSEGVIAICP